MADNAVPEKPHWSIAPYFIVDDVVATDYSFKQEPTLPNSCLG
jgi:hypothetical protein